SDRRRIDRHLTSCWTCRTELDRLRADIGVIVDAHNTVFLPGLQIPPPPQPWPGLDSRLTAKVRRPMHFRVFGRVRETLRRPLFAGAAVALLATITALVWLPPRVASADEVLDRTAENDALRLRIPPGHYVRQKVRVLRSRHGARARQTGE